MNICDVSLSGGLTPSTLYDFMRGKTSHIQIKTIKQICMGFQITLTEFFSKEYFNDYGYFLRKIEDPTIFSSFPSEQREKRQKQPFRATPDPVCKIGHVRVYFARMGCKIEDGFTDICGVPSDVFCA